MFIYRKIIKPSFIFSLLLFLTSVNLMAAGDHSLESKSPLKPGFSFEGPFGKFDRAQLRRGYQVYKEVCASCHAMKQLSFRNLIQPGGPEYPEGDVKIFAADYLITDGYDDYGDPIERDRILSDPFPSPFNNKEAAKASNNGAFPPDLSLIVKARTGGYNYIFSLLNGYGMEIPEDLDLELGDTLSYNPWYEGIGIAMLQPLYEDSVEYEDGTKATVEQMSKDVTAFLTWAAEPEMEERKRLGFIVMSFLIIFVFLMYLSTRSLWKDVH